MKHKYRHQIFAMIGCLMLAVSSFVAPATSYAAEGDQHIAMTPSSTEFSAKPGESKQGTVTVVNQGKKAFDVEFSTAPYYVAPDDLSYTAKFDPLEGKTNPATWVILDTTNKSDVKPNDVVDIRYTLAVPESAQPGGYYAVVFAVTTPRDSSESGVVAHNRVGQILYITVEGDVVESGEVSSHNVIGFTMGKEIASDLTLKNTGGKHFKAKHTMTVRTMFGNEVFNESKDAYLLPQTQRKLETVWNSSALFGVYKITHGVSYLDKTDSYDSWSVQVSPIVFFAAAGALFILIGLIIFRRMNS